MEAKSGQPKNRLQKYNIRDVILILESALSMVHTCEAVGSWEPDCQSMVNHCPTLWADNFVESRFPWFVNPDLVLEGQGL